MGGPPCRGPPPHLLGCRGVFVLRVCLSRLPGRPGGPPPRHCFGPSVTALAPSHTAGPAAVTKEGSFLKTGGGAGSGRPGPFCNCPPEGVRPAPRICITD